MSHLFESFEILDRGPDVRLLENSSPRRLFVCLLLMLFVVGVGTGMALYAYFFSQRIAVNLIAIMAVNTFIVVRYARVLYRGLAR